MLLMAHLGIALGTAYGLEQAFKSRLKGDLRVRYNDKIIESSPVLDPPTKDFVGESVNGAPSPQIAINKAAAFKVDYRFILLGSVLPDLIDKPIGSVFFTQVFNNARIFAHSLLFFLITILIGILVFKKQKKLWGFCIAFGIFIHLLLDFMWLEPVTLFWPFLGFAFSQYKEMGWSLLVHIMLSNLLIKPEVYISEIIGFIALIFFAIKTIIEKKVKAFILYGTL